MVEAADKEEVAVNAEPPELGSVERRLQQRAETLEVLTDPAWPGDGALGAPAARTAMWWCIGAAILLAFPRQYVAAIAATALSLVFFWLDRRNQSDAAEGKSDAAEPDAELDAAEPEPDAAEPDAAEPDAAEPEPDAVEA